MTIIYNGASKLIKKIVEMLNNHDSRIASLEAITDGDTEDY